MRFKDNPDKQSCGPGDPDKVMHTWFRVGNTEIMASDGRCEGVTNFQGFALAYSAPSVADADRVFAALANGGEVQMPLSETFFSPRFGMVADRFQDPDRPRDFNRAVYHRRGAPPGGF